VWRADVRVVQAGNCTSLPLEALARLRLGAYVFGQDLDGDRAIEPVSPARYTSPMPPAPNAAMILRC